MIQSIKIFSVKNGLPYDRTVETYQRIADASSEARKKGAGEFLRYWLAVVRQGSKDAVRKLFGNRNYWMPITAAAVFTATVCVTLNLSFALKVEYNGEVLGYIENESTFVNAEKQMQGRIVFEEYIKPEDNVPKFTMSVVGNDAILTANQLTDKLIEASGNELGEAYGLYVANDFLGAVKDRKLVDNLLDSILDKYRTGAEGETVEFVKDVEIREGLYPLTSIADISRLEKEVTKEESQQRIYTAVKGDAPILIAQKNNISYSELKALNPEIETKLLVGQEVLVAKSVPMLEVKVTREITYEEELPFKVEQIQDASQYQGYVKVQQQGKKGSKEITAKVTYIDGVETERAVLDSRVVSEPINEKVVVGGMTPLRENPAASIAHNTSSNFIWPVDGGYVSCGFGEYWGHTGMDIASKIGTPIRAAAAGTVKSVVYSKVGYGYHLLIDHGGNVQTLYAHTSQIYVKPGDWVEQGQLIAAVGRTGRVTGPHCHFEIRINGSYVDPAKYIGRTCPY